MTHTRRTVAIAMIMSWAVESATDQPWQKEYTGEQATGNRVVALWHFCRGAEMADATGKGHTLKRRGRTCIVDDGRFGSCLECFSSGSGNDVKEGADTRHRRDLAPAGAFTLEMWIKPKPEILDRKQAIMLADKRNYHYFKDIPRANHGYLLLLRPSKGGTFVMYVFLGFGTDSVSYASKPVALTPEQWHHMAFTYDGAGTVQMYLNGAVVGSATREGRGNISPGPYSLTIGDRVGSVHAGFPGYIDEVRLSNGVVPFSSGKVIVRMSARDGRTVFVRMEREVVVQVSVANDTGQALPPTQAALSFGGSRREIAVTALGIGESHAFDLPVDTTVRPDTYPLTVAINGTASGKAFRVEETAPIVIVPRPLPSRMPVIMWGHGDIETLKEIGFTHHLSGVVNMVKVWSEGKATEAHPLDYATQAQDKFNEHLAQGVDIVGSVAPGRWLMRRKETEMRRLDRSGGRYERDDICASYPPYLDFAYNVGASIARSYGSFPPLKAILINSEVRGHTHPSFRDFEQAAFREHAGYDIPREIVSRSGVKYEAQPSFPEDRVIPDDHPILAYYRWFWEKGDGWNPLHTRVSDGFHQSRRKDVWSFYDPAVRVPSKWGSGGGVDVISQWTYCYPDPIKIGQATDELFAMAAGRPGQKVMKMTQVIWYRRQTAPKLPEDESQWTQWEKDLPDARFITIAPDHLREAFWSKLSRPIRGIMYHGWGSLVGAKHRSYCLTNSKTRLVLAELVREVVRPLGPTLMEVPDRKSDVALLESFASQMFTRKRATWGWSRGWTADAHLILQWARLQPRIVYDETILRDGLDGTKVLVMPGCDVLTESVARRIQEFQDRGGIVVADEDLALAILPDILMSTYSRTGKAREDKAALQAKATALREELDTVYRRYGDSSSPDAVIRFRQYGSTDYLFVINDKRTFGDYVGHHGLVMEKGLPLDATVTVARREGFVYDLVQHQPVPARPSEDGLRFDIGLGPGAGSVFMVSERKIARVALVVSASAKLDQSIDLRVSVADAAGKPIDAVVPVQVEILDPQNRPAELSGYYAAKDGALSVRFAFARNDLPGEWRVRAKELASGLGREHRIAVSQ